MDFLKEYLEYTRDTESPRIYHRWCAIASIGAVLGRSLYIQHGHQRVYPNLYCMLIGDPAARKSTAIKLSRRLLLSSGYTTFAADKSSKEKFLIDLATDNADDMQLDNSGHGRSKKKEYDSITDRNLWGPDSGTNSDYEADPKEVFITADEFNEFAGTGNHELFTTLGNLWDWDSPTPFQQRFKSGSVSIWQPTVSLLGGNTQENFARAFPPEIIGQGFLSRLILIHGARTGKKIAFPVSPSDAATSLLTKHLQDIRQYCATPTCLHISAASVRLLTTLYDEWIDITDIRFVGYNNRRFTHLLKLGLVIAGSRLSKTLEEDMIIEANTYLNAAEQLMPAALGEFGKSKNSDVANRILKVLESTGRPLDFFDLWKQFSKDLDKPQVLGEMLESLKHAGKIQHVKMASDKSGWLLNKERKMEAKYVDWRLLTEEER